MLDEQPQLASSEVDDLVHLLDPNGQRRPVHDGCGTGRRGWFWFTRTGARRGAGAGKSPPDGNGRGGGTDLGGPAEARDLSAQRLKTGRERLRFRSGARSR